MVTISEETKKKITETYYQKAIVKAELEIGKIYNNLTITGIDYDRTRDSYYNKPYNIVYVFTKCKCGNESKNSVQLKSIKSGHVKSCGCYASEQIAKRNKKYSTKINRIKVNEDNTITLFDDNGNKCLIDSEDYNVIKRWYWSKSKKRGSIDKGYWLTNVKDDDEYDKSVLPIHQVIAKIKFGEYSSDKIPDHLSRDTNDNRKCNIILKSNQENTHNRGLSKVNSSGKTCVSFNKQQDL